MWHCKEGTVDISVVTYEREALEREALVAATKRGKSKIGKGEDMHSHHMKQRYSLTVRSVQKGVGAHTTLEIFRASRCGPT
jgi:hypothetical protein